MKKYALQFVFHVLKEKMIFLKYTSVKFKDKKTLKHKDERKLKEK